MMASPKIGKIDEELLAANQIPSDWFWWGSDYDYESDTLVFHALSDETERNQAAQLLIFGPHYLQRPALMGRLQFVSGNPSNLSIPQSVLTKGEQIVTIRATDRENINEIANFAFVCNDLEFRSPCGFSYEDFHQERVIFYENTQDQSIAKEATQNLRKLDGKDLNWYSMDSRFTSELVLSVAHSEEISHIVFSRPFFINLPKIIHNAVIRPASEDDLIKITSFFGTRQKVAQQYGRTNYSRYQDSIVIIKSDEGWFFVYNQGVGFRYKDD